MLEWLNLFSGRWLDMYKDGGDANGLMDEFMNDCFNEGMKGFKCYIDACILSSCKVSPNLFVQEHRHQVEKKDWEKGLA